MNTRFFVVKVVDVKNGLTQMTKLTNILNTNSEKWLIKAFPNKRYHHIEYLMSKYYCSGSYFLSKDLINDTDRFQILKTLEHDGYKIEEKNRALLSWMSRVCKGYLSIVNNPSDQICRKYISLGFEDMLNECTDEEIDDLLDWCNETCFLHGYIGHDYKTLEKHY